MYCKNLLNPCYKDFDYFLYIYYIKTCRNAKIGKYIFKIYLCFIRNNKNALQSF